jgi:hypothetical protein
MLARGAKLTARPKTACAHGRGPSEAPARQVREIKKESKTYARFQAYVKGALNQ